MRSWASRDIKDGSWYSTLDTLANVLFTASLYYVWLVVIQIKAKWANLKRRVSGQKSKDHTAK